MKLGILTSRSNCLSQSVWQCNSWWKQQCDVPSGGWKVGTNGWGPYYYSRALACCCWILLNRKRTLSKRISSFMQLKYAITDYSYICFERMKSILATVHRAMWYPQNSCEQKHTKSLIVHKLSQITSSEQSICALIFVVLALFIFITSIYYI